MTSTPYPLHSLVFWRSYGITLRPYLLFLSGVTGLVGLSIPQSMSRPAFVAAFAAFFFTYGLGQALTDVFQTDTDAISSPYRPLTQGIIRGRDVFIVSLLGLTLCGAVFLLLNPWTAIPSVLGIIGLATYTPFKRMWWSGPAWNSWIVALLPVIGVLCGGGALLQVIQNPVLWGAMVSAFFSYAIFVLLGYHKDISADRQTGYNTIPVVFGWKASVVISALYLLGAVAGSSFLLSQIDLFSSLATFSGATAAALWAAGIVALAWSHISMWRIREEAEAHRSIAFVVRGYTLFHLGEAVALRNDIALAALIFYGLFELVLAIRPEKSQI